MTACLIWSRSKSTFDARRRIQVRVFWHCGRCDFTVCAACAVAPPAPAVERDADLVGEPLALVLAPRSSAWRAAGRTVLPLMPNQCGWDFNDVVLGRRL